MKKFISAVLAVVMIAGLFTLVPMPAMAADAAGGTTTEVGKVEAGYTPVGTAVKTAEEFAAMTADGDYYLAADIKVDKSYASNFTGTFDGNGHTVTVSAPMFAKFGGTIRNLTIEGSVKVTGADVYAATIATRTAKGAIVLVENVVNNATVTGEYRAGGLLGQLESNSNARFINCVNNGDVTGTNMVGGIIGYIQGYSLEMVDCVNNGNVSVVKGKNGNCGGLVGRHGEDKKYANNKSIETERYASIVNCKNTGDVFSKTQAGGILGYARSATVNITGCINEGNITSEGDTAAGIVSKVGDTSKKKDADGNVVKDENGKEITEYMLVTLNVTNCVNTGKITMTAASPSGTMLASGIVGYVFGSGVGRCTIDRCMNLGVISSTFFASQFLGYSNNAANTIKDSIAAGKVESYNNSAKTYAVVFGLSNAAAKSYKISGLYYVENDGTEYYSYATAASNAGNRVKLADYLAEEANAGKINIFTAEELASGKIGAQFNKAVGKDVLFQTIGKDAAPTTDSTHARIELPVTKKSVKTAEEFAAMSSDGYYVLEADITISKTYGTFNGTLDGNGHTVTTTVPLFSKLREATVKNLVIAGTIESTANVGALSENASKVTVENVINNANVSSTSSSAYVGGIVGACNQDSGLAYAHEYSYFTGCVNNGDLSASKSTPRVGGIVGNAAKYQHCVYTRCVNNGDITVSGDGLSGSPYVAGIAGSSFGGEFINCINNGDLYSTAAANMGGILGRGTPSVQGTNQSSTAVRCINTGDLTVASTGSGSLGGIFGHCGNDPGDSSTRAVYTVEKCVNIGTLTSGGTQAGGMIGYIWGGGNVSRYSFGVVRNCVNLGKVVGLKNVTEPKDASVFVATFTSQFIGYVNASRTVIENSYGLGKIENTNNDYSVIFGLSGDTALKYQVANVYVAENDGTKNYSWACDTVKTDGKVDADRTGNRIALANASEKVSVLSSAELASGKVAVDCNNILGERLFYQNLGTDAVPTVDSAHAPVNLYGGKYFNINEGGASVRAVSDTETVGIRFRSLISKEIFDAMKADVAEVGVIIAPKAIADKAGEMTFDALEAYKTSSGKANVYVTLKRSGEYAKDFSAEELTGGAYEIKGSLVNIRDAAMEFTAVGYVKLADGTVFYGSTDTNSAKAVAAAAVADTKTAAAPGYENEVAEGVFSPYTKKAYESLLALAK